MVYNYNRSTATALRLIGSFGREAMLERAGVRRAVTCVLIDYKTSERQSNNLIQHGDQKCLIAARNLTVPPDWEQDVLILGGPRKFEPGPFEKWRIIAPEGKLDPAGIVVYWELQVRK